MKESETSLSKDRNARELRQGSKSADLIALGCLTFFIMVLAVLAVHASKSPNACGTPRQLDEAIQGAGDIERIWCPATWTAITSLTSLLVVVSVLQGLLFWWQLGLIRRGLADSSKSADAAVAQAKIAQSALNATTRPWIDFEVSVAGDFMWDINRGRVVIAVAANNIGSTTGVACSNSFPGSCMYA